MAVMAAVLQTSVALGYEQLKYKCAIVPDRAYLNWTCVCVCVCVYVCVCVCAYVCVLVHST